MHQAQGLQRLFAGQAARVASVLSGPAAPDSTEFTLALAAELGRQGGRAWLVDGGGGLADRLGCKPLLSWRAELPLMQQVIRADGYGLIHAPGVMAGDAALSAAAGESRDCGHLLFDGGRFSPAEAPLDPAAAQTLVILLGKQDAEAGYALIKALSLVHSPARVLLLGESSERIARTASRFLDMAPASRQTDGGVCQIGNMRLETSSNTLTIASNLAWVVSRIMQNDQPRVAHGGCSEGAEKIFER